MKLIQQAKLEFQEGSSDKVYEVELCEVGPNKYVVNFRFGRRGAALKEGTKTSSPVALANAQKIYQELINSKVKKGYQEAGASADVEDDDDDLSDDLSADERTQRRIAVIMTKLQNREDDESWPLTRVVWRAGELRLTQAEPLLLRLIGHWSKDKRGELLDYCVVWALGQCGTTTALGPIGTLRQDKKSAPRIVRVATEATRQILARHGGLTDFVQGVRDALPLDLREAYARGESAYFQRAMELYFKGTNPSKKYLIYEQLYLIDDEIVRPAILEYIRNAKLSTPHMRVLRHLFKAAEARRDGQIFGLIAYRFNKEAANYRITYWGAKSWGKLDDERVPMTTQWVRGSYQRTPAQSLYVTHRELGWRNLDIKEIRSDETAYAFSKATRDYMLRRSWRTLERLGALSADDYVKMAVGVLLPFSDADAHEARQSYQSHYDSRTRRYNTSVIHYGVWATYKAFGHILYHNSEHQKPSKSNNLLWQYLPGKGPTDKVTKRQEAFPQLWDKAPVGLLHLLDESRCLPVHEFAVRALGKNKDFCAQLPGDALVMLLESPYEITARFGFELFKARYDANQPDFEVLVKVATCAYKPAREQALKWLEPLRAQLLASPALLVTLLMGHLETREFTRNLLRANPMSDALAQDFIARMIAAMLAADEQNAEALEHITDTLARVFSAQLRLVGFSIIEDLLTHQSPSLQVLAGEILALKEISSIPDQYLNALLASPHPEVRALGMRIFGQLSVAQLMSREQLLIALTVNQHPDLRQSARASVLKLAQSSTDFARRAVTLLSDALLVKETIEGTHADIVRLLRGELESFLSVIPKEKTYKLLRSKNSAAKDLGGLLLQLNIDPKSLEILEIVELGRHEILSVREACWKFMAASLDRLRADKPTALRVADSDWEDTRQWAFDFFETSFNERDWTPELLVSLCDSTRYDVQAWGKRLIQTYFDEAHGDLYLLRLSEHPSPDLQLFATNYLERFAVDNPEHLDRLEFYFTSILSRVNRGGVAKARVFDFLDQEAQKSEDAARIIGAILARQSLTIARRDRARAIETMTRISQLYPYIQLPLALVPVEVRHGV